MHKCVKIKNVEVVTKWLLIVLKVNENLNKLYFVFVLFLSMTTIEFGGGPTLDARRKFANLKDGSILPK